MDKQLVGALDSACNRTCAGETWVKGYIEALRREAPEEVCRLIDSRSEHENFRFGNGGCLPSSTRWRLPALVADRIVCIWVSAVPVESLGLLLGRDFLDAMGGVLDFRQKTLTCTAVGSATSSLERLAAGHLALPLIPITWPPVPQTRWRGVGLDRVVEMQIGSPTWVKFLLAPAVGHERVARMPQDHSHNLTEASLQIGRLAYLCPRHSSLAQAVTETTRMLSSPRVEDGFAYGSAGLPAPKPKVDGRASEGESPVPMAALRPATSRPSRVASRRTSSLATATAGLALLACALSFRDFGGRLEESDSGYGRQWGFSSSMGVARGLHPKEPGSSGLVSREMWPGVQLPGGPNRDGHVGGSTAARSTSTDANAGSEGGGGRAHREAGQVEGGKDDDWSSGGSSDFEGRPGSPRLPPQPVGQRKGQGGGLEGQDQATGERFVPKGSFSRASDTSIEHHFKPRIRRRQCFLDSDAAYSEGIDFEFVRAHECCVAVSGGAGCDVTSGSTLGPDGRTVSNYVRPDDAARDVPAAGEPPSLPHGQRRLRDGRPPERRRRPTTLNERVPWVKPGVRQMITQAWDRHRRDQLAISVSPKRVREIMELEWYHTMRKGIASDVFIMEVPLLCAEIFSDVEAVRRAAQRRGHSTGDTLTLKTGFDFRRRQDRTHALRLVRLRQPYFLVIAFPCRLWSALQNLTARADKLAVSRAEELVLLRFAVALAQEQVRGGRHFVLENPLTSLAWRLPFMERLRADSFEVTLDMCRFNLRGPGGLRHRKPTRLVTSSQAVTSAFSSMRCRGDHLHEPTLGGRTVTEAAGHYTKMFAEHLVKAMEAQFDFESRMVCRATAVNECYVASVGETLDVYNEALVGEDVADSDDDMGLEEEETLEKEDGKGSKDKAPIPAGVRAAVKRVHEATGHRSTRRLARALVLAGAPAEAIRAAKELKCAVCAEQKMPKARRPASLPPPRSVGERVHLDLLVVEDSFGQGFVVAHATDAVSKYQLAEVIPDKSTASVVNFLLRLWWPILGAPQMIVADQGREFISEEFADFCALRSVVLWHTAVQAPYQNGVAERSGGILKSIVASLVSDHAVSGREEMINTVAEACSAYNCDVNSEGTSPLQCVTGRQPAAEGSVLSHFGKRLAEHGLIDASPSAARLTALRESARIAMIRLHYSQTIRRAELARSREPNVRDVPAPGDMVFFWRAQKLNSKKKDPREAVAASRRKLELRRWHGPAILVAIEGGGEGVPGNAFLSFKGQLTKCALEHVRRASSLEQIAAGTWEEAIREIVDAAQEAKEPVAELADKGSELLDETEVPLLLSPIPPVAPPVPEPASVPTSTAAPGTPVDHLFDRAAIQQSLTRARAQDRQEPTFAETLRDIALRRQQPHDFREELLGQSGRGLKRPAEQQISSQSSKPTWPGTGHEQSHEAATEGLPEPQQSAEPPQPSEPARGPEYFPGTVPGVSSDPAAGLSTTTTTSSNRPAFEALTMTLEELQHLGYPGDDVHPLLRIQALAELDRLQPSAWRDECQDHGSWDGRWSMPSTSQHNLREQLGIPLPRGAVLPEHEAYAATSRKEYHWSRLSPHERELWEAAATKGWNAYVDNNAVRILSPEESLAVKKDLARRGELDRIMRPRFVLTDKADGHRTENNPLPVEASARLVVPGFRDRANLEGELRRDAPTGSRLSQHLLLSLVAWFNATWTLLSADVKSAFLKGDPYVERELYLSGTDAKNSPAIPIPDGCLARVLKGVFGLADAPRQWWLRLARCLEEKGWKRSPFDQAAWFLWSASASGTSKLLGALVSHVDDLLFGGDEEAETSLREVGDELGFRDLERDKFVWCGKQFEKHRDGTVTLSMRAYHDNLRPIPLGKGRKSDMAATLFPAERKQLRALLGSLQWLVAQVRFDMSFTVSALQGEEPCVGTVVRANAALAEFQRLSDFSVSFRGVDPYKGGIMVVADAALGNVRSNGSPEGPPLEKVWSQACYYVLLASPELMQGRPGPFNILDTRSHRIPRVCRSSYSAETLGAEEAFDVGLLCRGFLSVARGLNLSDKNVAERSMDSVQLTVVVDAKDVNDKVNSDTTSFGSQKSLAFTVAWMRTTLRRPNVALKWTSTENMFADGGTKAMELDHLRDTISRGFWCVTYCPEFVKQTSKGKSRKLPSGPVPEELPGEPLPPGDPLHSHLLRLGEQRGWHRRDGLGINVAFGARSFRGPEPRFAASELPFRSSFGRFELPTGQVVWRVLERDSSYTSLSNQHALIGCTVPILVTFFSPEALQI